MTQRLYKKEKLCSTLAIESLFGRGADVISALAFPVRAVWRSNPRRRSDAPLQFMISVPKRRLRHAVDRVAMRRRIREAYRLNRQLYPIADGVRADIAFVYVSNQLEPYDKVERAMRKILRQVQQSYGSCSNDSNPDSPQPCENSSAASAEG